MCVSHACKEEEGKGWVGARSEGNRVCSCARVCACVCVCVRLCVRAFVRSRSLPDVQFAPDAFGLPLLKELIFGSLPRLHAILPRHCRCIPQPFPPRSERLPRVIRRPPRRHAREQRAQVAVLRLGTLALALGAEGILERLHAKPRRKGGRGREGEKGEGGDRENVGVSMCIDMCVRVRVRVCVCVCLRGRGYGHERGWMGDRRGRV